MEHSSHNQSGTRRKDDTASATGQTPGTASIESSLATIFASCVENMRWIASHSWSDAEKESAESWLRQYAKLADAARDAAAPPTPAADATEDLVVEFYARSFPLPRGPL